MSHEQIIETKINEFVSKNEAFTSVDIGNAIKNEGTWVRNRFVASWLRKNFKANDYSRTTIDVGNGTKATLYHPDYFDPINYVGQDQKAMNLDDFQSMHPDTVDTTNSIDDSNNEEDEDFGENSRK